MRRAWRWLIVAAVIGCKGTPDAPTPPVPAGSAGSASRATTPPPSSPSEPARARPVVSLAVNGSAEADVVRGRSLIVELALVHPNTFDPTATPLVIASGASTWAEAIRIEVRDHARRVQRWPLQQLVTKPAAAITLDGKTAAELVWRLSPEEVAAIPAGTYSIVAILDTTATAAPTAWKGSMSSVPITVTLGAVPSRPQAIETLWWLARDAALRGDTKGAAAKIDELLAQDPDSAIGLAAKGDLLADAGKLELALASYGRALARYRALKPRPAEPPSELLRKRNELLEKLETAKRP